jgi:hypothetical protein
LCLFGLKNGKHLAFPLPLRLSPPASSQKPLFAWEKAFLSQQSPEFYPGLWRVRIARDGNTGKYYFSLFF